MYGSHDMRHTGVRRLTVVNGTPGFWGVTISLVDVNICLYKSVNQLWNYWEIIGE